MSIFTPRTETETLEEMLGYSALVADSATISIKPVRDGYKATYHEGGRVIISAEGESIALAILTLEAKAREIA